MTSALTDSDAIIQSNSTGEHEEYVSLEYDYYDLQKSTKTPPSFDVTEEESSSYVDDNEHIPIAEGDQENFILLNDDDDDDEDEEIDILHIDSACDAVEVLNVDPCIVETEFVKGKGRKRGVRVKFQDLSKPYVAQVTSDKNYLNFLHIVKGEEATNIDMSPDSGINDLQNLSPDEVEKQKAEWTKELAKLEDDINTLKNVLADKTKKAQELKKKLGISVWREFNDDISQSIKSVKDSQVYQKTESLVKPVAEKATTILGGFGTGISTKIGQIKSSESFRSFEEKVGSAYENVKSLWNNDSSSSFQTKVSTSRSSSIQSFDDVMATSGRDATSPASTPIIPEEKEIK